MSESIGLVRLSHLCIGVLDLETSEKFYIDLLGGELVFEFKNETGKRYGMFISVGKGTFIELFKTEKKNSLSVNSIGFRHLCFQVENINTAADYLKRAGYYPEINIGRVDKVPQFWIEDPDGIKIEFHELSNLNLPQSSFC